MNKRKALDKIDRISVLTEEIKNFNLLQSEYLDIVNHKWNNDPVTNALFKVNELQRLVQPHIMLNYEIDEKIRKIDKMLENLYNDITKDSKNGKQTKITKTGVKKNCIADNIQ